MDFIEEFLHLTDGLPSPESFRLWAGLSALSGPLERKAWTETYVGQTYPNLYTILCGSPASGKTVALMEVRKVIGHLVGINLGPDNPTDAAFLDELVKSEKNGPNGMTMIQSSPMTVLCREFSTLIPTYSVSFLSMLGDIYDNPPSYKAPRRHAESVDLKAPNINILACATPAAIGEFPEGAWGQGFTSRVVFVYGEAPDRYIDVFAKRREVDMSRLKNFIEEVYNDIHGEFEWEEPARQALLDWVNVEKMAPKPDYFRLVNYNGRRNAHILKLSMLSAVSAGRGLTVTLKDFRRAQEWLFAAEAEMPDIFRAMTQKNDNQIMFDCHYWMRGIYGTTDVDKRQPIPHTDVVRWLAERVVSSRIEGIMDTLESSGRIRKAGGGGFAKGWIPNSYD